MSRGVIEKSIFIYFDGVSFSVLAEEGLEVVGIGFDQQPGPVAFDLEQEAVANLLPVISPGLDKEPVRLLLQDVVDSLG